jgi:hypothetical protein
MSSARNHAKRSHRSEHFKTSTFNASARKMYIREATKPKKMSFFSKLAGLIHRKNSAS